MLSQSVFKGLDEGVLSKKEINKYFDVSGNGKISYDAGKESFAFAKIDGDEKLVGGHDLIVVA